jgi:TolB-like protein/Tfp pilus assembly protein PilF
MNEFLQRLKERKLVQWTVAYVAAAFALLQGIDIVAQRFGWPEQTIRFVIMALSVGLFVTLVLAWYHGERGAQRVTGTELLILALLLAIGGGFLWQFAGASHERIVRSDAPPAATAASPAPAAIPEKSIAVLPFENLSDDKTNTYFATGMQDEILTRLAGIRDLKVISRTSTEQYASRPPNLKIVAEQLGVATVLEGSVQKAGAAVHINVQLLDARSDSHLWAQSYDRDLKDIFGVQRDVAQNVADALKAQLLPAESARIASVPTQNPEAYDLYLRANAHFQRAYDQSALTSTEMPLAIASYQQALAKDPGFALAAAMLAQAHMRTYWQLPDLTEARLAAAKAAAEQALALQPDLGEAHVALGAYWYYGHRDYAQALQQLDLARKSLPNSAAVELYVGAILRRQGQWSDAIAHMQRAIVLDPRSSLAVDQLAVAYQALRRYAESDQTFTRAVTVTRDPTDEQITQAYNTVLWKGNLDPLRAAVGSLTVGSDDYSGNASSIFQLGWWSRDYSAAAKVAETDTKANWGDESNVTLPRRLYLAFAYQAGGDNAKAQPLYAEVRTQMQAALQQRPDDPDLHLALGFAAAGLGLKDEAKREGRKATTLLPVSRDNYSGPGYLTQLAQIYLRVGENDQAIDTLRDVMAVPSGGVSISPALLKLDPAWDPLRKDPRFQKLIADGEAAQAQAQTNP